MKNVGNNFCVIFSLTTCLLLSSCGSENNIIPSNTPPVKKQTQDFSNNINQSEWKTIISKMADDFSFQYGEKNYQGKKKATGGRPFRDSIKRKGFVAYSHKVTDVKKINDKKYTVDVDASLELVYKKNGRKTAEWPIRFTWQKKGNDWQLASVKYMTKRNFSVTKQPEKSSTAKASTAPSRAYATQEAASSISSKTNYGSGNATQQKAKQSIKNQVKALESKKR